MTYYHVSQTSGITELKPHVPQHVEGERDIPRVCACPCIGAALQSSGADDWDPCVIYVYAIDTPPDVLPAEVQRLGTIDALDTGEVWWLSPVACALVDVRPPDW